MLSLLPLEAQVADPQICSNLSRGKGWRRGGSPACGVESGPGSGPRATHGEAGVRKSGDEDFRSRNTGVGGW